MRHCSVPVIIMLCWLVGLNAYAVDRVGPEIPGINTASRSSTVLSERSQQIEQCGIDSVYTVLCWYGRKVSVADIMGKVSPRVYQQGMKIDELKKLLATYSLVCRDIWGEPISAETAIADQSILIVPNDLVKHFYVYLKRNGDKYLRYNPPYDIGWVSRERFHKEWQGYGLQVNQIPVSENAGLSTTAWFNSATYFWLIVGLALILCIVGIYLRFHRPKCNV